MRTKCIVSLSMTIFAMGLAVTSCGDDDPSNEITSEKKDKAPKGVEAVDLGVVVDGKKVLWANMNVGAESPEEYGGYFAWGETVPYGGVDESNATNYSYTGGSYTKTYYYWSTYKYCKGSFSTFTKYVPSSGASSYGYNGFYDNKTVLDPEDDAATANWGADWRMPTQAEYQALKNQCTCTWVTTYNGKSVNGYKVSGNGHEIFLPAAGYRSSSSPNDVGSYGYYWSSSLSESYTVNAWCLGFGSGYVSPGSDDYRCRGFSVRPVHAAQEYSVFVSSLSLNKTTLTLDPDATETLTVSVSPSNAESHVTWTSSDESVATVDAFGVVTAKKAGTTVIRATTIDGTGKYAECNVTVKESNAQAAAQAVDLGVVVDGKKVLWANMNVGAESPTDYGGYFAWGETVPYGGVDESNTTNYSYTGGSYTKTYYYLSTYKYCKGSYSTQTKYVPSSGASSYGYNGFYDNKTVLDPEDDAATANWGADWRMPTRAELQALYNQCTWTWVTTYNGKSVNGYKVSGNGHEIFLPAAGYRYNNSPFDVGSGGDYWSSSLDESYADGAWTLSFNSGNIDPDRDYGRCHGQGVRPVRAAQN